MKYKIFATVTFSEKLEKQDNKFKKWFEKIIDQLIANPYLGKPLGFNWFREKKFEKFRVYYLVYDIYLTIYFVDISDKKQQQKTINSIKKSLEKHKKEIEELLSNEV